MASRGKKSFFAIESYIGRFVLVGLDASNEEWLAGRQDAHQRVERLLELRAERRRTLSCFGADLEFAEE